MNTDELHRRVEAFHLRASKELDALLGVHLDPATDQRFNRFHDSMLARQGRGELSEAAMRALGTTYAVREGFTATVFHQRNIVRIERATVAICVRAYADGDHGLPRGNASFGARTLGYEYDAFLHSLRAAFEYLANVAYKFYAVNDRKHFRGLAPALESKAAGRPGVDATAALARRGLVDFKEVFGTEGSSSRDISAHVHPVGAGSFRLEWDAGEVPHVVLTGGGEDLDGENGHNSARLAPLLGRRLSIFEDYVFELFAALPEFRTSVDTA